MFLIFRNLVEAGADINGTYMGKTPLYCATDWFKSRNNGHIAIAKTLLDLKADPEIGDEEGNTPCINAARHGDGKMVKLLLEHGARSNACNKAHVTSLMAAAYRGNPEICTLLLDNKAHSVLEDEQGSNTLDYAHESLALRKKVVEEFYNRHGHRPDVLQGHIDRQEEVVTLLQSSTHKMRAATFGEIYNFFQKSPNSSGVAQLAGLITDYVARPLEQKDKRK